MTKPKRPKVGDRVELDWIDSGLDYRGRSGGESLSVGRALGRVSRIGRDETLHKRVCAPRHCRCEVLELTYDDGGEGHTSSLGVVWWPSVVRVEQLIPKGARK